MCSNITLLKKSYALDPMPTPLLVACIDTLLPVITKIINLSLQNGIFADQWKCALVHPLLKKLGLKPIFQNFRSVSNLQYISKLTEKAVFIQTQGQMVTNNIYPELQSSYREHHSTETALLKVMNDVLLKMNSKHMTLLILLDLSAAFDTVDHSILLDRLTKVVGLQGKAHDWFCSYLSGQGQRVTINGSLSMEFSLDSAVPQGSCLGPLLFVIYTSSLFKIIECHLPQVHCYADDTQLYLSFRPGDDDAQDVTHCAMEACIKDIRKWMIDEWLPLNNTKTEFLAIGTRQQLSELRSSSIEVGNQKIDCSSSVRNLGVMLHKSLGMNSHINQICKASFYHIPNIRRISKYLSKEVTSRLDYCNSLLYGLPKYQLSKLQHIMNMAARLIMDTMKFDHINPVLYNLHWLPVNYRIQFKILMITFKAIHGMAPSYLSNLICIRSSSRYSLCNNDIIFLEMPKRGYAHNFRCPLVSCLCACAVEQLACAHTHD